ncbi:MAG TPA: ATP-binding protein, partial [bacterium]
TFNDHKTAEETLKTLKANPHILSACLYDAKGQIFVQYQRDKDVPARYPATAEKEGTEYSAGSFRIFRDILSGGERVGSLFLETDTQEMKTRLTNYVGITLLVGFLSFLVSLLVASHLQGYVTKPLRQVVDRMKDIARGEGDLTKRLDVHGKDEIGELAETFNAFVGKLQTVADMKLDLISVVSHQLKTPVAEINGFIENMMEGLTGELNPKQRVYLNEMRLIGRENYRLIGDLLSVSKIERGVVSVDLKPVSAKEVVTLGIRDYEQILQEKNLSLRLEGMEDGIKLYADREKVVEALRNLLNNAIKCTDKGTVTIRIGSEGDQGVIEVKDTGIGMDGETLGCLFTQNRVLGREAHRSGAGLGLYISKHFMNLQKGDITVTSEVGKGSCFKLTVPKLRQEEGAAA